jgi:hypothetical protein
MVDFGLAAQIGRGGGGGNAMAQPADPMNRMTQLMQLQNLQQNMMLARQQAAQEAELAPLRRQNLEADIAGSRARAGLAGTQGASATLALEDAKRVQRVNRGMLEVMARHDEGKIDLGNPDAIRSIPDPEVRLAVTDQLARARKASAEAEKANLDMRSVQQAVNLSFLDRSADYIDNPRTFAAAYKRTSSIFPDIGEYIPPDYNRDNAQRLAAFVRSRSTSIGEFNGIPVMITPGSTRVQEISVIPSPTAAGTAEAANRFAPGNQAPAQAAFNRVAYNDTALAQPNTPAGIMPAVYSPAGGPVPTAVRGPNPPATSQFGMLDRNVQIASPQLIGQAATDLVSPTATEPPIIQPRGAAPAPATGAPAPAPAPAPALSSRAAAEAEKTRAVGLTKAELESQARRRGAGEVLNAISNSKIEDLISQSTSGEFFRRIESIPGFFGTATSGMEKIGQLATIESQLTQQLAGGKLGGGISNADVLLIKAGLADIANPDIPANRRLAAFRQLKQNLKSLSEGKEIAVATPTRGAAEKNAVDTNNPLLR